MACFSLTGCCSILHDPPLGDEAVSGPGLGRPPSRSGLRHRHVDRAERPRSAPSARTPPKPGAPSTVVDPVDRQRTARPGQRGGRAGRAASQQRAVGADPFARRGCRRLYWESQRGTVHRPQQFRPARSPHLSPTPPARRLARVGEGQVTVELADRTRMHEGVTRTPFSGGKGASRGGSPSSSTSGGPRVGLTCRRRPSAVGGRCSFPYTTARPGPSR